MAKWRISTHKTHWIFQLALIVNLTKPRVIWEDNLNWGITCVHNYEGLSRVLVDEKVPRRLWATTFLEQVVLGCIRNIVKHELWTTQLKSWILCDAYYISFAVKWILWLEVMLWGSASRPAFKFLPWLPFFERVWPRSQINISLS